ncbi:MAG: hypothetical protein ACXWG1_12660 [Usitatibacter sp.]
MLEDIRRTHQPLPTAEERRWIATDPFKAVARIAILAVIAVAIGSSAGLWLEHSPAQAVAEAAR